MARNADIRKVLQEKLGVEQAQLYKRAEQIANSLSISTSDAILVLAANNNINLHKHGIAAAKLDDVRGWRSHVIAQTPAVAPSTKNARRSGRNGPRQKKTFRVKLPNAEDDPILTKATHAEMEAMVPVYRTLYHLENSIRQFITRVLVANHGEKWWDKLATSDLKRTYAKNTKAEEVNAWHQRRSRNPIDYLDLDQLPVLVRAAQADFVPTFFKTEGWFQHFVEEVYQSRCVVCHMNPLTQNNVDGVALRFNHWENLVKGKIGEVEKLEGRPLSPTEALPSFGTPVAAIEADPSVSELSDSEAAERSSN
jgi:Swt1-like HEPN